MRSIVLCRNIQMWAKGMRMPATVATIVSEARVFSDARPTEGHDRYSGHAPLYCIEPCHFEECSTISVLINISRLFRTPPSALQLVRCSRTGLPHKPVAYLIYSYEILPPLHRAVWKIGAGDGMRHR